MGGGKRKRGAIQWKQGSGNEKRHWEGPEGLGGEKKKKFEEKQNAVNGRYTKGFLEKRSKKAPPGPCPQEGSGVVKKARNRGKFDKKEGKEGHREGATENRGERVVQS